MKKVLLTIAALLIITTLSACTDNNLKQVDNSEEKDEIEITLWTFPVGNWGNPTSVNRLLSSFHKEYPNISVSVEYLNYDNGDEKIEQAIKEGNAPDLVLEGPERLIANWGNRGIMADLSDLWESEKADKIYDNIKEACQHRNGEFYEFPICMTAHCMAINYNMFKEAGALPYINEETHTWTTEGFQKAVQKLVDYGQKQVGIIYCKNQSGDQGTRALVNNLYGGSFTDSLHNYYTINTEENIAALRLLYNLEGITFEPTLSSAEVIDLFCRKEVAMSFCWNVSIEIQQTINNPNLDFEVFPMAFPTDKEQPKLQSGIWGFGIFNNNNPDKIEAAKLFIQYMTQDDNQYKRTVLASTYWPVRELNNIYENDMLMTEYSIFMNYLGDYYQITPKWTQARTEWWKMLQAIEAGTDISEAVKVFSSLSNNS